VRQDEAQGAGTTFADFVAGTVWADVAAQSHEAKRSILNFFATALGSANDPAVTAALRTLLPFSGTATSAVIGRPERLDAMCASFVNAISANLLDFDDTHLDTIIHPAAPVAAPVLALAQARGFSGQAVLTAFILGVEVECRIGNAVYPEHYDIGWHITGTAGVFGAAAAAGKILALDEQQMVWALGIAGTQSSGFREMFGTMCKSFHPGRAAQNGLTAAFLAREGFTSSNKVLEAPRGFANVMSTKRNYAEITENLGKSFEVSINSYKPFACGIVIHPSIDGAIQLKKENNLTGAEVERVSLRVAPLVLELTGKKTPQTGLEGKFSVYHSVAAALIYGAAGEAEYADAVVRDAKLVALRDRVSAEIDKTLRDDEAHLRVTLKDGRVLDKHVPHAIGSIERPMTNPDLEAKFRGLVDPVLGPAQSARLLALGWSLPELGDAAEISRGSVPRAG
jgi:2-methylcitrate dehydratase PrpD